MTSQMNVNQSQGINYRSSNDEQKGTEIMISVDEILERYGSMSLKEVPLPILYHLTYLLKWRHAVPYKKGSDINILNMKLFDQKCIFCIGGSFPEMTVNKGVQLIQDEVLGFMTYCSRCRVDPGLCMSPNEWNMLYSGDCLFYDLQCAKKKDKDQYVNILQRIVTFILSYEPALELIYSRNEISDNELAKEIEYLN